MTEPTTFFKWWTFNCTVSFPQAVYFGFNRHAQRCHWKTIQQIKCNPSPYSISITTQITCLFRLVVECASLVISITSAMKWMIANYVTQSRTLTYKQDSRSYRFFRTLNINKPFFQSKICQITCFRPTFIQFISTAHLHIMMHVRVLLIRTTAVHAYPTYKCSSYFQSLTYNLLLQI